MDYYEDEWYDDYMTDEEWEDYVQWWNEWNIARALDMFGADYYDDDGNPVVEF